MENDVIWFSCSVNRKPQSVQGRIIGCQFLVCKGSCVQVSNGHSSLKQANVAVKLRAKLESKGIIRDGVFTKDYVFDSPSIALKVITATSKGNLNAWTDGEGRTIKAMWEKATKRNQKDATKD